MTDSEKPVERHRSPGPGPRTPRHPRPEEPHGAPEERDREERDSPFPYADRFGEWVEDEAAERHDRSDG